MRQVTFSFPQIIDRTSKKIELSTGNKSINECLGILLRTRPGELLGDPDYGCLLIERIYMYGGLIVEELMREDILNAVYAYEPRVTMTANDIQIAMVDRVVQIYIQYIIKETGEVNEFNMELSVDDNPYSDQDYSNL